MKIAVIGATGAVGRAMIARLESLPGEHSVALFASARSAGESLVFKGKPMPVKAFKLDELRGFDYALLSVSGDFSKTYVPQLAELGVVCIDNSSAFRSDLTIPLIVPSVNGEVLQAWQPRPRIIANPNCSTIQLVACLKPLRDRFGLKEVVVSTYQSTSGAGAKGVEDLMQTSRSMLNLQNPEPTFFPVSPAFNVIPAIGDIDPANSYCVEEVKVVNETRRLLGIPALSVLPTTVRVPTFSCHCESVLVQLNSVATRSEMLEAFASQPDLVIDSGLNYQGFPSPQNVAGKEEVFLSRVRLPLGAERSDRVQFWCVADNVLKGAATNAVQILELMLKQGT